MTKWHLFFVTDLVHLHRQCLVYWKLLRNPSRKCFFFCSFNEVITESDCCAFNRLRDCFYSPRRCFNKVCISLRPFNTDGSSKSPVCISVSITCLLAVTRRNIKSTFNSFKLVCFSSCVERNCRVLFVPSKGKTMSYLFWEVSGVAHKCQ